MNHVKMYHHINHICTLKSHILIRTFECNFVHTSFTRFDDQQPKCCVQAI